MSKIAALLDVLLPPQQAGALAADYEDFLTDAGDRPGLPLRRAFYLCDLLFYACGFALRRRRATTLALLRRETRRDPLLYAGLAALLPTAYLYAGLGAYFVTGGGGWLILSGHYPLELDPVIALVSAGTVLVAALLLGGAGWRARSPLRRPFRFALGVGGCALGALLHYAAYF